VKLDLIVLGLTTEPNLIILGFAVEPDPTILMSLAVQSNPATLDIKKQKKQ